MTAKSRRDRLVLLVARSAPRLAPLRLRKALVVAAGRLHVPRIEALTLALLSDLATERPADYHRFLWSRHLAYARFYDTRQIDIEKLHPLRRELMQMAADRLAGVEVTSFLDVGCSLGYLARHAETTAFPAASRIVGVDIDEHAVGEGAAYLKRIGSRVSLAVADVADLDGVFGDERFDVVTCTGVLLYLDEHAARKVVAVCLRHTRRLFCVSAVADPTTDNRELTASVVRAYDHTFIHNVDAMIEAAGGRVVTRRWGGRELVNGNSVYLLIAEPPG